MTSSTLHRGARGGGVTLVGQVAKTLIQLASVIVLSRLLSPEAFGLVAMVAVFVSLGEMLRDFGFPTAALQAKSLSKQQAVNLFWVNTTLGVALGVILLCATPLIVMLYDEAELSSIVPVMALVLVLNGAQVQVQVDLARSLKFRALVITDLAAQLLALVIAIIAALGGAGYWALVAQAVASAGILLFLRLLVSRGAVGLPKRHAGTAPLLRDGLHFGASQLLTFAASNADTVSIGAQMGPTPLGLYNRAYQLMTIPVSRTLAPLTRVAVPAINRASDDGHDAVSLLLRVQSSMGIALIGVFSAAAATAPLLIPFVLGPEWVESVLLFQILAIGGSIQVLSFASYWGFLLIGTPKSFLHYTLTVKPVAVILVVTASFFGVEAVAVAYTLGLAIAWPTNLLWLRATAGQPFWPFFWNGIRTIGAGVAGYFAGSVSMSAASSIGPFGAILIGVGAALATYLLAIVVSPGGFRSLRDLMKLVRGALG